MSFDINLKPIFVLFGILAVVMFLLIPSSGKQTMEIVYKDTNKTIYCPKGMSLEGDACVYKVKAKIVANGRN